MVVGFGATILACEPPSILAVVAAAIAPASNLFLNPFLF